MNWSVVGEEVPNVLTNLSLGLFYILGVQASNGWKRHDGLCSVCREPDARRLPASRRILHFYELVGASTYWTARGLRKGIGYISRE